MSAPLLAVNNLCKRFASTEAVHDVSFSVKAGEIVALLGPNGAGKTTTIRMLISILEPSAGEILYFGMNLRTQRSEILNQVAFASTYTNVPLFLTVEENLHLHGILFGMTRNDIRSRVSEILEQFQIRHLTKKRINQISSGQRTRVMLARAFLPRPKVVLLDEPTASLDLEVAHDVRQFLVSQGRDHGLSILFSSHNMAEVTELCDRVIFLDHGRIIAEDTPTRLARSTASSRIMFSLANPEAVLEIIARHPFEQHGETFSVDVPEPDIPSFISELVQRQAVLSHLQITQPSLEEYFLRYMRGRRSST